MPVSKASLMESNCRLYCSQKCSSKNSANVCTVDKITIMKNQGQHMNSLNICISRSSSQVQKILVCQGRFSENTSNGSVQIAAPYLTPKWRNLTCLPAEHRFPYYKVIHVIYLYNYLYYQLCQHDFQSLSQDKTTGCKFVIF